MKRDVANSIGASSKLEDSGESNKKQKLSDEGVTDSSQVEVKGERTKEQRRKDKKVSKVFAKIEVSTSLSF
jgi:hypothetical protein